MKLSYPNKRDTHLKGLDGLPKDYPIPNDQEDMLFFIQRNQNQNTVVYQLNRNLDGFINQDKPLNVYWKEYEKDGVISNINYLQERLAYGYSHKVINNDTMQISIVSYPSYKMYISKEGDEFIVSAKFNGQWNKLTNIYAYAEDFGAFPSVKYVEFYGVEKEGGLPCYEKVNISE